jgi:hypothetical protein
MKFKKEKSRIITWAEIYRSDTGMLVIIDECEPDPREEFGTDKMPIGRYKHISMSFIDRYPTWDEIKEVKNKFIGEDEFAFQMLPSKNYYVNVNPNVFHLWHFIS